MMNVVSLQEQVRFYYGWDPKNQQQHIFDVVATLDCDARIAFAVKPEVRLVSGRFETEMQEVAWWVRECGGAEKRMDKEMRSISAKSGIGKKIH